MEKGLEPSRIMEDEDEIDLADLMAVLFQKRWLIIGFTILITFFSLGAAITLPKKVNVEALIQISQVFNADSIFQIIESPKVTIARLESIGKVVAIQMDEDKKKNNANEKSDIGFSVDKDFTMKPYNDANILSLSLKTSDSSNGVSFINESVSLLIKKHDRLLQQYKNALKQQIRQQESKTLKVENDILKLADDIEEQKREYAENRNLIENTINKLNNTILNKVLQKESGEKMEAYLDENKKEISRYIMETEQRYTKILEAKFENSNNAKNLGNVGLILHNSQIQQLQSYLLELRQRLTVEIPEQIDQIRRHFIEIERDILNIKGVIKQERIKLQQLGPGKERKIKDINRLISSLSMQKQDLKIKIREIQEKIGDATVTKLILPPKF